MRNLFLAFLLGAAFLNPPTFGSSSPLSGLWHVVDDDNMATMGFVVGRESTLKIYSPTWGELSEVPYSPGGRVEFKIRWQGKEITFKGEIEQGILKGEWRRFHVQYEISGAWSARHVSPDPTWEPVGFEKEKLHRVVNVSQRIVDAMPFADYASFKRFWETEIEPRYYSLLTIYAYRSDGEKSGPALREERLHALFAWLQKNEKPFQETTRLLPDLHKSVVSDLERQYSWFKPAGSTVLLPSFGQFDFSTERWEGDPSQLLVIGVDWLTEDLRTEGARKYFLAQGQIEAFHSNINYLGEATPFELFKRGLVIHLSQPLLYSKSGEDLLALPTGSLQGVPEAFQEHRRSFQIRATSKESLWVGPSRAKNAYLAYQFMAGLKEGAVLESFLKTEWKVVPQAVSAFLSAADANVDIYPVQ